MVKFIYHADYSLEISSKAGCPLSGTRSNGSQRLLVPRVSDSDVADLRHGRWLKVKGVVSHGSDLSLHHFRLSMLSPDEARCALEFRNAVDAAVQAAMLNPKAAPYGDESQMLLMRKDGVTQWANDWRWPQLRLAETALGFQQ